MSEVLELEHLFRVSARDRHETVVPHERGEPALRAFLIDPTEGMMPRVRSMRLSELLRSAATIGRTAAYPVAAKSISTTAMIPTKAIVVSSCLGSRTKTSSAFATGPSKAIAAAAARIHEARL